MQFITLIKTSKILNSYIYTNEIIHVKQYIIWHRITPQYVYYYTTIIIITIIINCRSNQKSVGFLLITLITFKCLVKITAKVKGLVHGQ